MLHNASDNRCHEGITSVQLCAVQEQAFDKYLALFILGSRYLMSISILLVGSALEFGHPISDESGLEPESGRCATVNRRYSQHRCPPPSFTEPQQSCAGRSLRSTRARLRGDNRRKCEVLQVCTPFRVCPITDPTSGASVELQGQRR